MSAKCRVSSGVAVEERDETGTREKAESDAKRACEIASGNRSRSFRFA